MRETVRWRWSERDGLTVIAHERPAEPAGDCYAADCPARAVLAHVTGRWGALVIGALLIHGTLRFSQLRARIEGVSEKMLAQTLRELARDGVVARTSRPVVPPHVEYALTPLGRGLAGHVAGLIEWIGANLGDVLASQREHDETREAG